VARKYGCTIHIDSRISSITYQDSSKPVTVTTMKGTPHSFDLVIGADGVNGFTRRALFPEVVPISPTNNSAYRAIVPYSRLLEDPETRSLVQEGLSMDVWMSDRKYIISYPISAGKDFNMVLSHHTAEPVSSVQDVEKEFVMEQYKEFDPRMRKVISMIEHPIQRWPLLVTGPLKSWSTECKRVVLMGDAAHSMVNHMAQGAATAMEDGVFLGVVIKSVLQGLTSLEQAMKLYEKERMPKARRKQEVSFLNGEIWHLAGEEAAKRDAAMKHELDNGGTVLTRSPNLYADPQTVREVYGYDAQTHAVKAVEKETSVKEKMVDRGWRKDIRKETWDDVMGWFVDAKL
jgi:salicylate hydroxylase